MEGALGGKVVLEVIVEGEEINVVHDHVVTLIPAQQEANVEERGTIKPARYRKRAHLHKLLLKPTQELSGCIQDALQKKYSK